MMSSTTEKAAYVWTEINKTDDEVAKELTDQDADTRIYATSVTILRLLHNYSARRLTAVA